MKSIFFAGAIAGLALCMSGVSYAQGLSLKGDENGVHSHHHHQGGHHHGEGAPAPIGVMGDHIHDKGEWMFSYRFERMEMEDNRDGSNDLDPSDISGVFANRFFGIPGQPASLRIVPTSMRMDMHMFGAMYAPSDDLTLMVMGQFMEKDMDHITFAGANPNLALGTFKTQSEGWGDTKLSGLFKLSDKAHTKLGVSFPTGSLNNTGAALLPNGTFGRIRLPYAMQLGSGTYDFEPGITIKDQNGEWGWGLQYGAQIRLGENDEGYTLGDKHSVSGWLSYLWQPSFSTSIRFNGEHESDIDGIDSQIVGPVQTADPDYYGGARLELGVGASYVSGNHEFAAEIMSPILQKLNGPQLKRDYRYTLGYRIGF